MALMALEDGLGTFHCKAKVSFHFSPIFKVSFLYVYNAF